MTKWMQGRTRERAPNWRGGRFVATIRTKSYVYVYQPDHPRANRQGYVFEHVLVVLRARRERALPTKGQIHHVNGDGTDNRRANLVVCENDAYHKLLHQRERARATCGNANWVKCTRCGAYDDPVNLRHYPSSRSSHHRLCNIKYCLARRVARRAAAANLVGGVLALFLTALFRAVARIG